MACNFGVFWADKAILIEMRRTDASDEILAFTKGDFVAGGAVVVDVVEVEAGGILGGR